VSARRRSKGRPKAKDAPESIQSLKALVRKERQQLFRIHASATCLARVLMYGDGPESSTHSDAAELIADTLIDVITRLDGPTS